MYAYSNCINKFYKLSSHFLWNSFGSLKRWNSCSFPFLIIVKGDKFNHIWLLTCLLSTNYHKNHFYLQMVGGNQIHDNQYGQQNSITKWEVYLSQTLSKSWLHHSQQFSESPDTLFDITVKYQPINFFMHTLTVIKS